MAESAYALSARRPRLPIRAVELHDHLRALERTAEVPVHHFLGSLALLAALLFGVWGLVPHKAPSLGSLSVPRPQISASLAQARHQPLAVPQPAPEPAVYLAEEGDTLASIADNVGVEPESIAVASNLAAAGDLKAGQPVRIPPAGSVPLTIDPDVTVRDLAAKYEIDAAAIMLYNGLESLSSNEPLGRRTIVLPPIGLPREPIQIAALPAPRIVFTTEPAPLAVTAPAALYLVQPGETLSAIAERFGLDSATLVTANHLADADLIRVGDQLGIPGLTVLPAAPSLRAAPSIPAAASIASEPVAAIAPSNGDAALSDAVSYTVVEGDTISQIADRFGVDTQSIVQANHLADADTLQIGDELRLPVWSRPAVEASTNRAVITSEGAVAEPRHAPVTYEVSAGDTISEIAERYGVDTQTIVASNQLRSADTIQVGTQLSILPISGVMHTVRAGETLSGLAALYEVDLGPIIDFNYLESADVIVVGRELIIPGARPLRGPTVRSVQYQVAPGDTLLGIANRFGVSTSAIIQANTLSNPDRLSLGTTLTIPGGTQGQPGQQLITRNLAVPGAQTPPASSIAPAPTSSLGETISAISGRYLGSRYVWGGTTPSGFDCSGLVYYVHAQAGRPISRGMYGQYSAGPHPSRGALRPGDIVFFANTYMAGLSHNGIYIGGGQFIHAVDERSGVRVNSLSDPYWSAHWYGATRVL